MKPLIIKSLTEYIFILNLYFIIIPQQLKQDIHIISIYIFQKIHINKIKFLSKSYYEWLLPFVYNKQVQNDIVYWYGSQLFQKKITIQLESVVKRLLIHVSLRDLINISTFFILHPPFSQFNCNVFRYIISIFFYPYEIIQRFF